LKYIIESERKTCVIKECDVPAAGGGACPCSVALKRDAAETPGNAFPGAVQSASVCA